MLITFLVACAPVNAGSGRTAAADTASIAPTSVSTAGDPPFSPGPASVSGRVVRLVPGGLVVDSGGRDVQVELRQVIDVWKETSVPASAIEMGDDVIINGTDGSPFAARYVWSNIGRVDGVIRAIDATGMDVARLGPDQVTRSERVDFSAYIQYGAPGVAMTRADLVVGRTIGAVVYRPRVGALRATRIW